MLHYQAQRSNSIACATTDGFGTHSAPYAPCIPTASTLRSLAGLLQHQCQVLISTFQGRPRKIGTDRKLNEGRATDRLRGTFTDFTAQFIYVLRGRLRLLTRCYKERTRSEAAVTRVKTQFKKPKRSRKSTYTIQPLTYHSDKNIITFLTVGHDNNLSCFTKK